MDSAESRLAHAPRWQVAAAAATALWCAALTIFSPGTSEALVVQMVRDGAMLGWLGATFWSPRAPMPRPLRLIRRMLATRSEEHTSELQSLMRNSYADFCLQKKNSE